MRTFSAKPSDVNRQWHILDASKTPLGRLSTVAATLLTGKHKPSFTKHIDCGDYVIIINAAQTVVTGAKLEDKKYHRHSQYPGGLTTLSFKEKMQNDPSSVIEHAIRGMLPINKLRTDRLKRLKVYSDDQHQHEAQKPIAVEILVSAGYKIKEGAK